MPKNMFKIKIFLIICLSMLTSFANAQDSPKETTYVKRNFYSVNSEILLIEDRIGFKGYMVIRYFKEYDPENILDKNEAQIFWVEELSDIKDSTKYLWFNPNGPFEYSNYLVYDMEFFTGGNYDSVMYNRFVKFYTPLEPYTFLDYEVMPFTSRYLNKILALDSLYFFAFEDEADNEFHILECSFLTAILQYDVKILYLGKSGKHDYSEDIPNRKFLLPIPNSRVYLKPISLHKALDHGFILSSR